MTINFNTEPYNDDFSPDNKFYRILFRPGFAVQARELTQLQTILQNQIQSQGSAIYTQGSMVIPGQVSIDISANYVKLGTSYGNTVTESFIGQQNNKSITSTTSGIKATIVAVSHANSTDPTTIFVKYTSANTIAFTDTFGNTYPVGSRTTFTDGETITIDDGSGTFQTLTTVGASHNVATGIGSLASVARGVYYVNGFFVLCADPVTGGTQTIILDKYDNTPSYRVGLTVSEKTITPEVDSTLLDNAQTSYNYAAPGAHRYFIDLTLSTLPIGSTSDSNFIELLQVENGQIQRIVNTTQYSIIEDELARRTYDEAGNYTVSPFQIDVREARTNNRGTWAAGQTYLNGDIVSYGGNYYVSTSVAATTSGNIPPTTTSLTTPVYDGPGSTGVYWQYTTNPIFNRGISLTGDANSLAIGLEPGKAYVQGYEITKVATEYVTIPKTRDASHQVQVAAATIPQTVGNYVLIESLNYVPPVDTYAQVTLYNETTVLGRGSSLAGTNISGQSGCVAVGTARIGFIEWDNGTIGSATAQYKAALFDIEMNAGYTFAKHVKSMYYAGGSAATTFTADIVPTLNQLAGAVNASSSTTVTGVGTSFQTSLSVGDYIQLGSSISNIRRVTAISSQNSITVDSSVTITNDTISLISAKINEPQNESLIFPLPYYAVKSVTAADASNRVIYSAYEKFTGTTTSGSGGYCTLTIAAPSGVMISAAQTDNYQIVDATTGLTVSNSNYTIAVNQGSATITLPASYASRAFVVLAAVTKTSNQQTRKNKTLLTTTVTFTSQAAAQAPILNLGQADGYKIISILQADNVAFGTTPSSSQYVTDIGERYTFSDGQTPYSYELATLTLSPSAAPPSAPVQVTFQYFAHGTGDYFTVDSYTNVPYALIPTYQGTPLRDAIDFRSRKDSTGIAFTGSGGAISLIPKRGINIEADFSYYLARTDKIAVDQKGNFYQIQGTPSLNPGAPADPNLGMLLYTLNIEPYCFSTTNTSVIVTKAENKRYTMRDIGKLESRINQLEYYTSLSLLEQQTQATAVHDPNTGMAMYQNGFVVDNFSGTPSGDTANPDYLCSIDMQNNVLRPFYTMNNVNLIEANTNNTQRAASDYQVTGSVITLPYTSSVLISQPYGSRLENINPFAIYTFLGKVILNPSTDDWFETNRLPDIINQVMGDFNTIQSLAAQAGILGTVWNAWQTQWTGSPQVTGTQVYVGSAQVGTTSWLTGQVSNVTTAQLNAMFGVNNTTINGGWGYRTVTTQTSATQVGQSRTGVNTQVAAQIDTQLVNDSVLSQAVIPYIRSRNILVQATGLKPLTTLYPFFDTTAVGTYCTPSTKITINNLSGTFDITSSVGGNAAETARQISGDSQVCLNIGDVIHGATSHATGVLVGLENILDTNNNIVTRNLYLQNVIGTFQTSETVSGSISGATATTVTIGSTGTLGGALTTDTNGKLQFIFDIPDSPSLAFRTGQRTLTLTDDSSNGINYSTRGQTQYNAQGILQTKQATYNAVQNAQLVQTQVTQNQTITQTSQRVVSDTGWYDPLAETFLISNPGGAFLTGVDIFFASKDRSIPVHIEIREVVNGYPGINILPFSQVTLNPEQVNISSNTVTLPDGTIAPSYDTPTRFTFPSPVYVNDATSYALVVASDSNGYKAWCAQMGDTIPGSSRTISAQPYNGVLFKSQNGSTWTASQDEDLMFNIYYAQFDTTKVANVSFVNDMLPITTLPRNPFETNTGSAKVKVTHYNHGLPSGSSVTLGNIVSLQYGSVAASGGTITTTTSSATVTGTGTKFTTDIGSGTIGQGDVLYGPNNTYIGVVASVASDTSLTLVTNAAATVTSVAYNIAPSIGGIPVTEVYKSNTVAVVVDQNTYVINTTTTGKTFGYFGGTTATANGHVAFNALQPSVNIQTFPNTTSNFFVKTITGQSINGSESPYISDTSTNNLTVNGNSYTVYNPVVINDTNYFQAPRMVASQQNENSVLSGNKSLQMTCIMTTSNPSLSPVLDTSRLSLIAIGNVLNQPLGGAAGITGGYNQSGIDSISIIQTNTTVGFSTTGLITSNSTVKGIFQNLVVGKYLTISGVTTNAGNNGSYLITGVAADGSSVTLNGTFTAQSAGDSVSINLLNAYVDEIAPVGSSTLSKYVTKQVMLNTPATTLKVTLSVNSPANSTVSVYYKANPAGASQAGYSSIPYTLMSPDTPVPDVQLGDNTYSDISWTLNHLAPFDSFTVKIVFTSTNMAAPTTVKDLRIIATS